MKALLLDRYGGPDVMRLGEHPDPRPARGEVLLDVRAASVNPIDWKVRSGAMRLLSGRRFPRVPGGDVAGVVAELGPGVTELAVGDRVYGVLPWFGGRDGSHAERAVARAGALRRAPDGLPLSLAAAVPIAGLTALVGLERCGPLEGRKVLVNGATGGVGHFAVQIARARGASVTARCGRASADFARELGAEAVLDREAGEPGADGARFDVVFDAFGALPWPEVGRALVPGGVYATTLPMPGVVLRGAWARLTGGPRTVLANLRAQPGDWDAMEALLADGRVKVHLAGTWPLARGLEAWAAAERGGLRGKVVVVIGEEPG